ncbi:MAG: DUF697 domain-containing protein [Pseudomonadota bacterium]
MMEAQETAQSQTPVIEVDPAVVHRTIKNHMWASAGMGIIPVPWVDLAGVTLVQLNMLRKISGYYGVPFMKNVVKNLLGSLLGGAFPAALGAPVASATKAIPVIGTAIGVLTAPVIGAATTYAVAKVFVQHFASGGTFLTFDPQKVKAYYAQMFKEGQEVATEMKAEG